MTTDTIKWGETYDLAVQAKDTEGDVLSLAGYQAAARFVSMRVGGGEVATVDLTIGEDDTARCSIDTGAEGWAPGPYRYDIRFTDPDGNDYWSDSVKLVLQNRDTPASE